MRQKEIKSTREEAKKGRMEKKRSGVSIAMVIKEGYISGGGKKKGLVKE